MIMGEQAPLFSFIQNIRVLTQEPPERNQPPIIYSDASKLETLSFTPAPETAKTSYRQHSENLILN